MNQIVDDVVEAFPGGPPSIAPQFRVVSDENGQVDWTHQCWVTRNLRGNAGASQDALRDIVNTVPLTATDIVYLARLALLEKEQIGADYIRDVKVVAHDGSVTNPERATLARE